MMMATTAHGTILKVWWHAATLFVYFIFFLHSMVANGHTVYDEAIGQWLVMICNGDLRGIGSFQDVGNGEFAWIQWSSGYSQQ
jgi:hypothetical protein